MQCCTICIAMSDAPKCCISKSITGLYSILENSQSFYIAGCRNAA